MLHPTECSVCREPGVYSRERRRTIDDDYDKQSQCPREFMLYRPSSRSSWSSPLSLSPSPCQFSFSNCIILTRESHSSPPPPPTLYKSEKSTHSSERSLAPANQAPIQYIATRPRHFPGSRTGMIFQGFVYVSAAIRFSRIVCYPIRLRAILHANTVVTCRSWGTLSQSFAAGRAVRSCIYSEVQRTYHNKWINLYEFLVWFLVCGKHYLIFVGGNDNR